MKIIDLNADLGEGIAWESELLPLISSANVCSGAHAGSPETTRATVEACLALGIRVGAHPGYPDRENFGRTSIANLKLTQNELNQSLKSQLALIPEANYIKPHGAFYNETSTGFHTVDPKLIADTMAGGFPPPDWGEPAPDLIRGQGGVESIQKMQALLRIQICLVSLLRDTKLPLMGLANNTPHKAAAQAANVPFIAEGFIDRRYGSDHRLLPRSNPDAIIHDHQEAIDQALRLAQTCDSLCVHGDNPNAPELLAKVRRALKQNGYTIAPK